MGKPRSWFGIVQNKFFRPPPQNTVIVLHANSTISTSFIEENRNRIDDAANEMSKNTDLGSNRIPLSCSSTEVKELSEEDTAAIKIQAFFRGHLVLTPLYTTSVNIFVSINLNVLKVGCLGTRRETGISGVEGFGEAASSGPRGSCEKTVSDSLTLHARTCSIAHRSPFTTAPRTIKNEPAGVVKYYSIPNGKL
ncbi:hypothetical protein RHGRI_022597 [Rhododendron griersonianum]|uniref:Uncharacterized protein n=1 Tax=Rhododendron griersonianum TaxID=479676 RepID=A0AAV6J4P5_9ERIC|nr:hypothetical protein RHGRI_022597 [Rhododendron griersonianum]